MPVVPPVVPLGAGAGAAGGVVSAGGGVVAAGGGAGSLVVLELSEQAARLSSATALTAIKDLRMMIPFALTQHA